MTFFEQLSVGDRVEVDAPIGGILRPGINVNHGDRGTVIQKRKGNWLDPVSTYLIEMDHPCEQARSEISGRFLKKVNPAKEKAFAHKDLDTGAPVTIRIYEPQRLREGSETGGILLPDAGTEARYTDVAGVVLERRPGTRRNEPDQYLVKWDTGKTSWHGESSISAATGQEH